MLINGYGFGLLPSFPCDCEFDLVMSQSISTFHMPIKGLGATLLSFLTKFGQPLFKKTIRMKAVHGQIRPPPVDITPTLSVCAIFRTSEDRNMPYSYTFIDQDKYVVRLIGPNLKIRFLRLWARKRGIFLIRRDRGNDLRAFSIGFFTLVYFLRGIFPVFALHKPFTKPKDSSRPQ